MRKFVLPATWAAAFMAIQLLASCSDPLETVGTPTSPQPDPVVDVDTITTVDTIFIFDTVIIVVPDSTGIPVVCSRLSCKQKKITLTFHNSQGLFNVKFVASTECQNPSQTLSVIIDGHEFEWKLAESLQFSTTIELREHSTVQITPEDPRALGHGIDICLSANKL